MEKSPRESADLKTLSLLKPNDFFSHKILSRNSSVGSSSSRSYFCRATVAVPFQWEATPGKPKLDPHDEEQQQHDSEFVPKPPLITGPPPGMHSLEMARTSCSGPLISPRSVWLWKKLKKKHYKVKKNMKDEKLQANVNVEGLDQFCDHADFCKFDVENMKFCSCGSSNSRNSSWLSSTASASLSSTTASDHALGNFRPSNIQRLARGFIRWAF